MKPEIRFNGFSDDWVEKKLGDVTNLMQGAAWKSSEYLETGPNLLITISNLKSAIVDTSFGNRLAEVSLDLQKKYGIDNNDVLVSMTGNVGRVSIYKDCIGAPKALLNQRVGKVIPVNIDNLFLYAILRNELFERKMIDKGQGAAQLNISSKDIQQFLIQLPTLPEQQKIGALFSKYDTIIGLREQKLEELNALKKGLLQQMFPKTGAKVPELRFKGFADDWEEHKVGNFLSESRIKGSNGLVSKKLTVKLWRKGIVSKEEIYKGSSATQYYVRLAGQFMYGKLDFLNQAFGILPNELDGYESTLDSPAFDFNDGINPDFFLEYVCQKSFYKYQGNIANGSRKAKRIHVDTFFDMPISIPSLSEQQKIGQLFKQLDVRISNEQSKIEQLKAQKQGLLQRML